MISFLNFLMERSDFSAQDGESEVVHHTTPNNFTKFRPLSHFGSKGAAGARAYTIGTDYHVSPDKIDPKVKFNTHSARLKLGKVADIDDDGFGHSTHDLGKLLHKAGHFNDSELDDVLEKRNDSKEGKNVILNHLKNKGINTLRYKNSTEDPGSTSYIITHPSQVRTLRHTKNSNLNLPKYHDKLSDID